MIPRGRFAAASPRRGRCRREPRFPHSGAAPLRLIAIGRESIRYSLTLWPSALPPEVAQELLLAAPAGPPAGTAPRFIHDKVTLVVAGRAARPGPDPSRRPRHAGERHLVVGLRLPVAVRDLLIRDTSSSPRRRLPYARPDRGAGLRRAVRVHSRNARDRVTVGGAGEAAAGR